jgi:hypothetical protein
MLKNAVVAYCNEDDVQATIAVWLPKSVHI